MKMSRKNRHWEIALATLVAVIAGCSIKDAAPSTTGQSRVSSFSDPLEIALAPHEGAGRIDEEIRHFQTEIRSNRNTQASIDRLGWLYVAKARATFDAGYYTLAEQCALVLDRVQPNCPEGLLLGGHTLHSQHRFEEAESRARKLVAVRGLAPDFGLLGDVLIDLGRPAEAASAYQRMLDLRPDPQGYARAAHLRWLNGDLEGAIEVMRMAVSGSSPRDPDSAAWMHVQLARYFWLNGNIHDAGAEIESALALLPDYPPALLLRGRLLLADGRSAESIEFLERAAEANPLPEYQWVLSEAYRLEQRLDDAGRVEKRLNELGPLSDPRTFALFLATRRENPEIALRLAREEISRRRDVFSRDTLAVALIAAGRNDEAKSEIELALALGTPEPRLWLHAGVVAARNSNQTAAVDWFRKAAGHLPQLLPSERTWLQQEQARLENFTPGNTAPVDPAPSILSPHGTGSGQVVGD